MVGHVSCAVRGQAAQQRIAYPARSLGCRVSPRCTVHHAPPSGPLPGRCSRQPALGAPPPRALLPGRRHRAAQPEPGPGPLSRLPRGVGHTGASTAHAEHAGSGGAAARALHRDGMVGERGAWAFPQRAVHLHTSECPSASARSSRPWPPPAAGELDQPGRAAALCAADRALRSQAAAAPGRQLVRRQGKGRLLRLCICAWPCIRLLGIDNIQSFRGCMAGGGAPRRTPCHAWAVLRLLPAARLGKPT